MKETVLDRDIIELFLLMRFISFSYYLIVDCLIKQAVKFFEEMQNEFFA